MSSMKDFINRHGHLSMCVIIILLVAVFLAGRHFIYWTNFQAAMHDFCNFSEQEDSKIFITAQMDRVKIVTKTAEIDIKDHPELFDGLCAAEFTKGDYALVSRGFSLNGKDIYYLRAYLKDAKQHITFRISITESFSCVEYDDKSFYIDIDEKIVEYLRELIDEIGEYQ